MRMEWREYVPVGQRKAQARRYAEKVAKKRGFSAQPVANLGRKITTTFWGNAWCENLESYSDFANRLPRGRTYARNGSVVDLVITKGQVNAIVGGSDVYEIKIKFALLKKQQWETITERCAGSIDSVMSLLQGRFDQSVMADLSRQKEGLFPTPGEIELGCDCPDWAYMCKHVAAVLYGIGVRLDNEPQMLFLLRGVDHLELITSQSNVDSLVAVPTESNLAGQNLSQIFGIEFDTEDTDEQSDIVPEVTDPPVAKRGSTNSRRKKTAKVKKKVTVKKTQTNSKPGKKTKKKKVTVSKTTGKKKAAKKTTQNAGRSKPAKKKTPSKTKARAATKVAKKKAAKKKTAKKNPVNKKATARTTTKTTTQVRKKSARKKSVSNT
jgi:uncharacterized Zn finger protein